MRNLRHREVKYLVPGHLSVAGLGFESMKFISGLHALNPWGVLFMGKVPYYLASKVDEWPWMSSWFTGFPQNSLCWPCFSVVLSKRTPVQMGTGSLMHSASYRVGVSELLGGARVKCKSCPCFWLWCRGKVWEWVYLMNGPPGWRMWSTTILEKLIHYKGKLPKSDDLASTFQWASQGHPVWCMEQLLCGSQKWISCFASFI